MNGVLHTSGSVFDNARFIRILSAAKRYCCKYGKKGKSKSFHSFGEAHILIGLFTCGLLEAKVYADSSESAVNYRENPQDTYLVQHVAERSPHTLEPDEPFYPAAARQNLAEPVQKSLSEGLISPGHAKVLLGVTDAAEQNKLAVRVIAENLSVRELEKIVGQKSEAKKEVKKKKDDREQDLASKIAEERMKELLGTRVTISKGARKGKIEIEYYSEEDLERILAFFER